MGNELLTVQSAAQRLQIAPEVLRKLIRRGVGPPVVRLGPRRIRIAEQDLEEFILRHRIKPGRELGR